MLLMREDLEKQEETLLAPYGFKSGLSRGRVHREKKAIFRTGFQRDIDRIVHSNAFRRLEYKTQVFVNDVGDHYRTRLTHTFEVAQVAQSIARSLGLNQDLARAIALAHDLGHTPFGHAGEELLNERTKDIGGFEHNRQSLRVVELLETRYATFKGLNLCWEVREGLLKHNSVYDRPDITRFEPDKLPTLEAQVVNIADELAYTCHDLEDGLRAGILSIEAITGDIPFLRDILTETTSENISRDTKRYLLVRYLKNKLVTDTVRTSHQNIEKAGIRSPEDARTCSVPLIGFSRETSRNCKALSEYLLDRFYFHHRVVRMTTKAKWFLNELFGRYLETPRLLPEKIQARMKTGGEDPRRVICDYIAGMTDRFALEEYKKLLDPYTRT